MFKEEICEIKESLINYEEFKVSSNDNVVANDKVFKIIKSIDLEHGYEM